MGAVAVLYNLDRRTDLSEDDLGRLVDALWDRYSSVDTNTRVWMLGSLPTKLASGPMASFDERVQQALVSESLIEPEIDSVLVAMVLMTRVEGMSSPVFDVARSNHDTRLGWMANMIAERIENIEPMYTGTENPYETFAPSYDDSLGL